MSVSLFCFSIHEALSGLQLEQLEQLRIWLTATEDRISQLGASPQPTDLAAASRMLEDHHNLQLDLDAQRDHVNALSNMVVIVDESASDSKCHSTVRSTASCYSCAVALSFLSTRLRTNRGSVGGTRGAVESRLPVG